MAASKHITDASIKIDGYLETLPHWSKNICVRLREIILKSDPKIIEDWKWGPNYYLEGMICGYAAFQKHVNFVFFQGTFLKDKKKILQSNTGNIHNRHIKFKELKEIDENLLLEYLIEAIENNKKGKKLIESKNKTLTLPNDVKKELKTGKVLDYFENLAYSHRKEYMMWIESAKKKETHINRIAKAITMLGKKEKMHDKYK